MADSIPPLDARLLALALHDLRNPLNGISMSWSYLVSELAAEPRDDVRESLHLVGDCTQQLHAMVMLLSDYMMLSRPSAHAERIAVDPRAFLTAIVEERRRRRVGRPRVAITLKFSQGGPGTVPFDAEPARIAARLALDNTLIAAETARVRIESRWDDQRWRTAFVIEAEPPSSVPATTHPLRFEQPIERLLGAAKDRHGLDLALIAWISERLNGRACLEGDPRGHATIVLDWPVPGPA